MKKSLSKRFVLCLLAVLFTICCSIAIVGLTRTEIKAFSESSQLSFISDSKLNYKIVISKDETAKGTEDEPATIVYCAAYDMQTCLSESLSKSLNIICRDEVHPNYATRTVIDYADSNKVICIGNNKYLEDSGVTFEGVEGDAFAIKTKGNNIFIYGKTDNAVLFGTYAFMEKYLGFKFLGNGTHYIPQIDDLILDTQELDVVEIPDFDIRTYYTLTTGRTNQPGEYELRMNNEFAGKSDLNTAGSLLQRAEGIYWYTGDNDEFICHTALDLVPYDDRHSSWFNGEDDLCYSNVGLKADGSINTSLTTSPVKIAIESIKEIILNNPEVKYISIGQEDLPSACNCSSCRTSQYKYSGLIIRFVNAISKAIDDWMVSEQMEREINFVTLAYQWSLEAPVKNQSGVWTAIDTTVIPRDNVFVRICPMQLNQYYAINDSRQEDPDLLLKWASVLNQGSNKKQGMIWSYNARMSYLFTYFPTMQHWKADFEAYKNLGVKYVFMQSTAQNPNDWKGEMEAYVASKLLWDIDLDPYEIRDEFIEFNYPNISDLVKDYVDNFDELFENLERASNLPDMTLQGGDEIVQSTVYGKEFWKTQLSLLDEMFDIALSLNDSSLVNKVKSLALTAYSTILYDYDDYGFVGSDGVLTKSNMQYLFFAYCNNLNVVKAGEYQNIEDLKAEWGYNDFDMLQGASIRLNPGSTGIRFTAKISEDYYNSFVEQTGANYDETVSFGVMIAPKNYFDGIEVGSDYLAEIAKKNYTVSPIVLVSEPHKESEDDTYYLIRGSISNILYANSNREFIGIAFIRTGAEGNYSYLYANLGDFSNISRSVTKVAVLARNDKALEDYFEILDGFIENGINYALKAEQGSVVTNPITFELADEYYIGQEIILNATLNPSDIGLKVVYSSSNESVAKVLNNKLYCLREGVATITAQCASFTVSEEISVGRLFNKYYAVGQSIDYNANYEVKSGAGNVSVNGNVLTFIDNGNVVISAFGTDYNIYVLDFTDENQFMDISLWAYHKYDNLETSITNEENVTAINNTVTKANTVKYYRKGNTGEARGSNMLYLAPEIVTLAKAQGYDKFVFSIMLIGSNGDLTTGTNYIIMNCDETGVGVDTTNTIIPGFTNNAKWLTVTVDLTNKESNVQGYHDGRGIGFGVNAESTYLSNIRFEATPFDNIPTSLYIYDEIELPNDKFAIVSGGDKATLNGNTLTADGLGKVVISYLNNQYTINIIDIPTYVFVGDSIVLPDGCNIISGGDNATLVEKELTGVKGGDVVISYHGRNYTINVIEFNGVDKTIDLATISDFWDFGNGNWDNNVTLTYANDVSDGNVSYDALDYSRPSNDGTNRQRTTTMLYIKPEVVSKAVDAGYTYISFYAYIPTYNSLVDSTYLGLFNTLDGGLTGSDNALNTAGNNGDSWKFYSIPLTALKEDFGIGFAINGQHLYLSNVRFTSKASVKLSKDFIFADSTLTLPNSEFVITSGGDNATLSGNVLTGVKSGKVTLAYDVYNYTVNVYGVEDIIGTDLATISDFWGFGNGNWDNNVTLTYANDVFDGNVSYDALDYSRPSNDGTNRQRTTTMLYIRPEVVSIAVDEGYSYISFYAYIPTYNSIADSTYLGLFNTLDGGLTGSSNALNTAGNNGDAWKSYNIPLTALKEDFGIGFAIMGQHLYLTNVYFEEEPETPETPIELPNYAFVGDSLTLPNANFTIKNGADLATLNGDTLTGTKCGDIVLSYKDTDYTIKLIDFGNVTGEATDLATVLDLWGFGAGGATDVTLTYVNGITDAYGTATMNALDYSRPSNTGANVSRTTKMLYIKPEIVSKAKALGYTHISFYAYIPEVVVGGNKVSTSTNFALLSTKTGAMEGSNNTIWTGGDNGDAWKAYSLSLSALKEGFGIGFAINGQHLYLSNVRFYGADISSVTASYFATAKTDRSKDLISADLIGKMYTTVSNTETLSYKKPGHSIYETDNSGNDYIELVKDNNILDVTNIPNGIIISADWIKAAKKAGYHNLALYFKIKDNVAAEIPGNGANIFRVRTDNATVLGAYNKVQTGFVNINLDSVAAGEFVVIGFKSDTLRLAGMTFRTGTSTSGEGYGWASANTINSGNLTLYKPEE